MQYVRMALRDGAQTPRRCRRRPSRPAPASSARCGWRWPWRSSITKQEILERYLNSAYFGHRAYGIYAAAEMFFSKSPKDLTLVEAATLAGLVKAPTEYDPATQDQLAATARRNYVIDQMQKMGYLAPDRTTPPPSRSRSSST